MLGKHLLKLFSYANQNRNRFLNFSVNPFFQSRSGIISLVRCYTTELSEKNVDKDVSFVKFDTARSYYWRYFLNNSCYNSYFNVESTNLRAEDDVESIRLLSDLANKEILNEENIKLSNEILVSLENEINTFNVEKICKTLLLLCKCKFFIPETNMNLEKIKKCIDVEICRRQFSYTEILQILSTLNILRNTHLRQRNFYFAHKAVVKLLNKIDNLSPKEIVLFFFSAPKRNFQRFDSKFFVLSYLSKNMSLFNSDETGIIAHGLFKLNLSFSNDFIFSSFLNKIITEIDNIHSVPFRSVCKVLQKFVRFSQIQNTLEFQGNLLHHVSILDAKCILEAAAIGLKQKALNAPFKELLINRTKKNLKNFTLNEILRLLNLTVSYNIQDQELLALIKKEVDARTFRERGIRQEENTVIILKQLSHHQIYPKQILDKVFSLDFVSLVNSRDFSNLGKVSWWCLYCNASLEKPECCNSELNASCLKSFQKINQYLLHVQESHFETNNSALNNIKDILTKLYGEDKIFQTNILPHYGPGIVLRMNEKFEVQNIPEKFRLDNENIFKKPLEGDGNFWILITPLSSNEFLWESDELGLPRQTQLRQLKGLGYVPVMVKSKDFKELGIDEAQQFVLTSIKESLKGLSEKKNM